MLGDLRRVFERSGRSPDLLMLISGARGTGKTALLSCIADEAQACGWVAASVTSLPGMLDDIIERTLESAEHLLPATEGSKVTDVALRMGVSNSYAGQYKNRLLAHGVIGERRRGVVAFELPVFRKYLEEMRLG